MTEQAARPFKFIAGDLALDFTCTVSGWDGGRPRRDYLAGYEDLIEWAETAGIVDRRAGKRLSVEAAQRLRDAARAFTRAVELRQALYRLFDATASGRRPAPADLEVLNAALVQSLPHQLILASDRGFGWGWDDAPDLDRVLWPVLRAAAELLTSGRLARVRRCGGERCGWLFLDETKNRSRRWCEMSVCGNRAKARRHYRRSRAAAAGATG